MPRVRGARACRPVAPRSRPLRATCTRAAASSSASGNPSSARQIRATAAAFASVTLEVGEAPAGTLDVEPSCGRALDVGQRVGAELRDRERGNAVLALRRDAQRRPARHERLRRRDAVEEPTDVRRRVEDLLEVVQHEQGRRLAEGGGGRLERILAGRLVRAEHVRDRGQHERGVAHGREIDEDGVPSPARVRSSSSASARLARSTGPREGDEAGVGTVEERRHGRELELPADQGRGVRRGRRRLAPRRATGTSRLASWRRIRCSSERSSPDGSRPSSSSALRASR